MDTHRKIEIEWFEYITFSLMILICLGIGLYYGKRQTSTLEYVWGGKNLKTIPVALSLVSSFITAASFMGFPVDVYSYGIFTIWSIFSNFFMFIFTSYVSLPVFFQLQSLSLYEYLEKRFDERCRLLGSLVYSLPQFLFLPLIMYIPAMASATITKIDINVIIIVTCSLCVLYTTIGGLRTIVWTDILQYAVTISAMFCILIFGTKHEGGFMEVWTKAKEGGRLDIFIFDPDPRLRDSFWVHLIGISFVMTALFTIRQCNVQTLLLVPNINAARSALLCFVILYILIQFCGSYLGLILYARYSKCDPVMDKKINDHKELVAHYLPEILEEFPGFTGLIIAGFYGAALSTFSANLNCLSVTLYEDFITKFMKKTTTDYEKTTHLKIVLFICGVICTGLVFLIQFLGPIVPLTYTIFGLSNGPLLGIFVMGLLMRKIHSSGAFYGGLIGFSFSFLYAVTALFLKNQRIIIYAEKEYGTFCSNETISTITNTSNIQNGDPNIGLWTIFRISHIYYTMVGFLITIFAGAIISLCFGTSRDVVDENLLSPLIRKRSRGLAISLDYNTVENAKNLLETI